MCVCVCINKYIHIYNTHKSMEVYMYKGIKV